jgi:tRNA 2-thiocytidine biosynthesis protein TtcA
MILDSIARNLLKSVNRAVREFELIADGDRIAVGVSGGKDSRVLLDVLRCGVDIPGAYTVVAVHIDGTGAGLSDIVPTLEPWFRELGVDYDIAPLAVADDEPLPMDCFRCARNRRKTLFIAAERMGCNKVAFGHHADDAAVTTLMSLMVKGRLETLEPRRSFFDGRLTLIRPLIYTTEKEIARYARAQGWTFPPELDCPREAEARRSKLERFLATFRDKEQEQIRANLWRLFQRIERIPTDYDDTRSSS